MRCAPAGKWCDRWKMMRIDLIKIIIRKHILVVSYYQLEKGRAGEIKGKLGNRRHDNPLVQ